jgi:hypothetical protein
MRRSRATTCLLYFAAFMTAALWCGGWLSVYRWASDGAVLESLAMALFLVACPFWLAFGKRLDRGF